MRVLSFVWPHFWSDFRSDFSSRCHVLCHVLCILCTLCGVCGTLRNFSRCWEICVSLVESVAFLLCSCHAVPTAPTPHTLRPASCLAAGFAAIRLPCFPCFPCWPEAPSPSSLTSFCQGFVGFLQLPRVLLELRILLLLLRSLTARVLRNPGMR